MSFKLSLPLITLFVLSASLKSDDFKQAQKRYPRVRKAYADKEELVKNYLKEKSIEINKLNIYLRAFKKDKTIEVWGKNQEDNSFKLIKEFVVCRNSGKLGPKRQEGDLQVPEGFYHINIFNPSSNFYLSMGLNYPNKSDRILGVKGSLGGDIYIHGACVTIGCLPITDDKIKELYLLCVEAKNNGQAKIPVTIFPTKLSAENHLWLQTKYSTDTEKLNLWSDLKKAYDSFNQTKSLPSISFLSSGRHVVK